MAKSKNIERAQTEPFRNQDTPKGKKRMKCTFPPCQSTFLIDENTDLTKPLSVPPFCTRHLDLAQFMMWLLPQIQIKKQETPSGIVLPGHKQFGQFNPEVK